MKFSLCTCALVLTYVSISQAHLFPYEPRGPLKGNPAYPGSVWPMPFGQNSQQSFYSVDVTNFETVLVHQGSGEVMKCPTLDFARGHYTQLIRALTPLNGSSSGDMGIGSLKIEMASCLLGYPTVDDSLQESNTITVSEQDGSLSAVLIVDGPWGAIRGLETFYQLIWSHDNYDDDYNHYYINETMIIDRPRFNHRGLMLDTARHYQPERKIIEVLTAMMYNKLNVFHWHIVDDQSFPYVSRRFPELSDKGAYNKADVYTPKAVSRIIEGARVRGIRVILEFDTPGHGGGFGKSHQEILTPCYGDGIHAGTPDYPRHTSYENIDPSNDQVYTFMHDFFEEIAQNVTKDSFIHLGMDEAYTACWESSPVIKNFMIQHGYTTYSQVQGHYTKRLVELVKNLGLNPIAWQDPLDSGVDLDKDVIVQVWKDGWIHAWKEYLSRGYKVLLSACWYINYISYGESWRKYYECDPVKSANVPDSQISQILGGEAAIWGEFVDQTNVLPRLFPFASAVAEVLWTDVDQRQSTDDAMWRLDRFRCSLLRRGIPAQPILNGHCGSFEVNQFG